MMTLFLVLALVALLLSNGALLVMVLVRLAEERREIGDARRLAQMHRYHGRDVIQPGR
ncbi:hypothetical protein Ga0074812_13911 [Parafrankia irregularis]|uniref:Uncharacterized protein n=1 Tax=Parafrankia irregularis TaxID=795642 RepID=A0A0S4R0U5_9ACTN|nr:MULTISPECIES: hypothetical protein [Parafrankia]MBE3206421.1 hypothetical protein [Parafrankia sp. CH37]CUU60378.1 hypothetical protein Ga0074812_13911 [Parafrankia irregularis]